MKVYGECYSCNNEISYSTGANTRVEFAMQDGENINLNCKNCGVNTEFNVDKLYAKESKFANIVAGLFFLIGTPLVFFFVSPVFTGSRNHYAIFVIGSFLLVPVFAYVVIKKQDRTRVNSFNRSKLKGRIHNI